MRELEVKSILLQQGRPKIAVPVTATTHEGIMEEVKNVITKPCDILEWRADYFFGEIDNLEEKVENTAAHMEMIRILDDIDYQVNGRPVIFTIRGHGHGGRVAISREHAYDLSSLAAQSQLVDFIDMELLDDDNTFNKEQVIRQINEIHEFGVRVILSYHDYEGMPSIEQLINMTRTMRELGADIVKIAGTAAAAEDAENMMKAAAFLTQGDQDPVIFVAMGNAGIASRIEGGKFGSCITFARGNRQTADGQQDAITLAGMLDECYMRV